MSSLVTSKIMNNIKLQAFTRDQKPAVKAVVLAELYGPGVANQHLVLDLAEVDKLLTKINSATPIDLAINDQAAVPVLIREIQREPLKNGLVHLDFFQIDPKQRVSVAIDLEPVGKSLAITNLGATLVKNMRTLKISCLPQDLITKIEVDLAPLATVSDVIRVADLVLPDNITVKNHPREAVFSLMASRKGRAVVKGEEGAAAPAAAPDKAAPAKKEEKKGKK